MSPSTASKRPFPVLRTAAALALVLAAAAAGPARAGDAPLAVGTPAPAFTVVAHDGQKIDLAKLKGKYVVLYFYPMDDTPGCTKEANGFRDSWTDLQKQGVVVLGVSSQGIQSHKDFAAKYSLPFPLLPDEKHDLAGKYKVPVTLGIAHRVTYLIGKDGKIAHVWPSVNPTGHAAEILAEVQAESGHGAGAQGVTSK
jgi:peroxiredoxin Q/BCP